MYCKEILDAHLVDELLTLKPGLGGVGRLIVSFTISGR